MQKKLLDITIQSIKFIFKLNIHRGISENLKSTKENEFMERNSFCFLLSNPKSN